VVTVTVATMDRREMGKRTFIDEDQMIAGNIGWGEVVYIQGSRTTASFAWPARAEDRGKGIIRMDALIQRNAGTHLNETVQVQYAEPVPAAKQVALILPDLPFIAIEPKTLEARVQRQLLSYPLTEGDMHLLCLTDRREVRVRVQTTLPAKTVYVTNSTIICLLRPTITSFCPLCGTPQPLEQVRGQALICPACTNTIT
jgi:hypothetical protein